MRVFNLCTSCVFNFFCIHVTISLCASSTIFIIIIIIIIIVISFYFCCVAVICKLHFNLVLRCVECECAMSCRKWRRNVSRNERMRWQCIVAIESVTFPTFRFRTRQWSLRSRHLLMYDSSTLLLAVWLIYAIISWWCHRPQWISSYLYRHLMQAQPKFDVTQHW